MQILSQAQRVSQVPSSQLENTPASKEALMFLMRIKDRRLQQQQCEGGANISQQIGGAVVTVGLLEKQQHLPEHSNI